MVDEAAVKEIADEAKSTFNLMERLRGRPIRTQEVTVYTDEVAGAEHEALATRLREVEALSAALVATDDEANLPEIERLDAQAASLRDEVKEAARAVEASGLTFKLRAVPPKIAELADKATRKHLGVTDNLSTEQVQDFVDEYTARLLKDSVEYYRDHATDTLVRQLTIEEARELKGLLPRGEFEKLDKAIADLSARAHISENVARDADF